jgi:LAS superfamily LD-carboxypeptidase LdcB
LPLLPVAAIWAGAGARALSSSVLPWSAVALCAASWFVPVGLSASPRADLREAASAWLTPTDAAAAVLSTAGIEGSPIVCDSAALAWRSGRRGIVLPDDPRTLRRIRDSDVGSEMSILALGQGRASWWLTSAPGPWDSLLSRSRVLLEEEGGAAIFELPDRTESSRPPQEIPSMTVDKHHTLPPDYVPAELVELPSPPASREGIQVTAVTWLALEELLAAAEMDGIDLRVISGYRSHDYQTQLFARAVENHGEDQAWVAAPGQSEHQLGTTVDVADAAMQHALDQSFGETAEGQWLRENCGRFGFRLSYTSVNEDETGILAEPWHLRFWGQQ